MLSWRALGLFCNKKTINSRALKTAIRKMYFIDTKLQSLRNYEGTNDFVDLQRFVSVCTSLFCNRIIAEDFRDLNRFGRNPGTKLAPKKSYNF
jgi:hypothetical protein